MKIYLENISKEELAEALMDMMDGCKGYYEIMETVIDEQRAVEIAKLCNRIAGRKIMTEEK